RFERRTLRISSLLVGLVVTGPLLAPGFVLVYDMVFVPNPPLSSALLGLSRNLPRSVPTGLLVSLASKALTGQVVEKLILLAIFAGAAYGAARLVPADRMPARVAAGLLYAWNPFLYERLLLGHWSLLLGYAVLPWIARAALDYRRGEPGAGRRLILTLAAAVAAGPYAGLFGVAVALAIALFPPAGPTPRRALALAGVGVVINLPWLVPGLLHQSVPGRPALALELFRARSDSPLGTLGSLLSLGGLWRTDLAPPGRHGGAWIPAFLLIVGLGAWGWRRLGARWSPGALRGLVSLAVLGIAVAIAPSFSLLDPITTWVSEVLPGGAILRDSQKFVIPFALLGCVAFGAGVDRILEGIERTDRLARRAALLLPLLPVALAPTLLWGAGGRLSAVSYPPSWGQVESAMAADPVPGAVLVLPWHSYLPFGWNHGRTVRQIAPAYFSRPVVADTALQVGRVVLPAEDPWSRRAAPAVTGRAPLRPSLAGLGVRYVVLHKEADWRRWAPGLEGLVTVIEASDLRLYRAAPPDHAPRFPQPPAAPVLAAHAATLALVLWAALASLVRARPRAESPDILRFRRFRRPEGFGGDEE
ncbi:MAG TPA: hypothetical protein VGT06_08400, partial [Candidatus Methylomirabilis sp.]|nr:hypothetical protein [Candidatus Methylomirabilis sp.]